MRHTPISILAAACLLLAACDNSGTSSDATTSTVAPTATAVTTTTEAPAPSTEAPTTTIDTEAQLAAAEQAYLESFDAYLAASRDPSNLDLRADIDRLYTGPSLEFTISQLDGFAREGWAARPTADPSRTTMVLSPQFLPDRNDVVELVACEVNTERFVEVGGAPDGSDSLVNDGMTVRRALVRLELVEGQWRARSGETLAEFTAPEDCS